MSYHRAARPCRAREEKATQQFNTLLFTLEDGIATVSLNRPNQMNAISHEMVEEFSALSRELYTNDDVRVVVFTGAGRAFSAGGDLSIFEQNWPAPTHRALGRRFTNFFEDLEWLEKPVIAAINGPCAGAGLHLALCCDIRIASAEVVFAFRESNIGLIPGAGGSSRLVKLIGLGKALELILTGESFSAEDARQMGLVQRVAPHEELMNRATELARHLLTRAPLAMGMAKRVLRTCQEVDRETGLFIEQVAQSTLLASQDHREGVRAFREKRKPAFQGR